jgi:hypothetical protein
MDPKKYGGVAIKTRMLEGNGHFPVSADYWPDSDRFISDFNDDMSPFSVKDLLIFFRLDCKMGLTVE